MGQKYSCISSKQQPQKLEESTFKSFLKNNDYEYQKVLGKGDFSQVVMAFSQKQQCQVAIKILKKLQDKNKVDLQEFEKEFLILQMLKNQKYVLQIVEKIQDDKQGLVAIVTEFCVCNLTTIFEQNKLNLEQVVALAYQLLEGLLLFQENGIIHSNIKPQNILYSKSKNQFMIADYGQSKILNDTSSQNTLTSLQGNNCYKSPEVLNRQKPYTISVDVFSIGQLLIEAYIQRRLEGMEQINLKSQNLLTVLPFLQYSPDIQFVNKMLCKMVEPNKDNRLQPITLLQNLKGLFTINENSLKQLKVQKKLPKKRLIYMKTLKVKTINDIIKGKDYDVLDVDLNHNQIGAKGASDLGSALANCTNLSHLRLDLGGNEIGDEGASGLGSRLANCTNLSHLRIDLGGNEIGDEGASGLGSGLANCTNLSHLRLDLGGNKIGDKGASGLLANCTNLSNLTLFLDHNQIGAKGASGLGSALANCTNLSNLTLKLEVNKIGDEGASGLGSALANCTNLSNLTLKLEWNKINEYQKSNIFSKYMKAKRLVVKKIYLW